MPLQVDRRICELRTPQAVLDERFDPGRVTSGYDVPVMRYGIALSDEEVLQCAERLRVAPLLVEATEADGDDTMSADEQRRDPFYQLRTRDNLLKYLRERMLPGSAAWARSSDVEHPQVLSLYTNYDEPSQGEIERELTDSLKLGRELSFKWYWDLDLCGRKSVIIGNIL